jgi:hypothetical protein
LENDYLRVVALGVGMDHERIEKMIPFSIALYIMVGMGTWWGVDHEAEGENKKASLFMGLIWPIVWAASITVKLWRDTEEK